MTSRQPPKPMLQDEQGNVTFLVSNQSFDISPVDIEVLIDEQVAIRGEFDVQGDQLPQHNLQQFRFQLEKGKHTIIISSVKGDAQLDREFEVTGSHAVIIIYWYNPNSKRAGPTKFFTMEIRDQLMGFM